MKIYFTNEFNNQKGESHRLLAKAITAYTGIDAEPFMTKMEIGELGKPAIEGIDDFSISHSRNTWAVLFDVNSCGLDVQEHRDVNIDNISARWFHEDEIKYLSSVLESEKNTKFFEIWARREALVKSVGTSIVNAHLPCTIGDGFQTPVLVQMGIGLETALVQFEGQTWQITSVTIPGTEDMSAAVCCKEISYIEFIEIGGSNV